VIYAATREEVATRRKRLATELKEQLGIDVTPRDDFGSGNGPD
jgi:hypothetical protein